MGGKINLYNLGVNGIDLTRSVVHAEDGTLRQTQNAIPDIRGEFGGLAKRDGLTEINSTTTGGSVRGVVSANLPATTVKTYIGIYKATGTTGAFATSQDNFATAGVINTALEPTFWGAPGIFDGYTSAAKLFGHIASPGQSVVLRNKLFYNSIVASTASTIRVFDGETDKVFTSIPVNPDAAGILLPIPFVIMMLAEAGKIYISMWDDGNTSADLKGTVYQVDAITGEVTRLGATFPTGYLPYALTWYNGRLWAGTYSDDNAFSGRVYWIRPGIDTDWTLDHTTTAGQGQIFALMGFRGKLYAATGGSSTKAALVKVRATDGTWTTSQTGSATTADQNYLSLAVFNDRLYASYYNHDGGGTETAVIQKFDGTSWTTALTPALVSAYLLNVGIDVIFAAGIALEETVNPPVKALYVSSDGATWADRTANYSPAGYGGAIGAFAVLTE